MGGASSPSLLSPAAPAQKWPAPTGLQGAPAFNVVRTDAAFAANIDNRNTPWPTSPMASDAKT